MICPICNNEIRNVFVEYRSQRNGEVMDDNIYIDRNDEPFEEVIVQVRCPRCNRILPEELWKHKIEEGS